MGDVMAAGRWGDPPSYALSGSARLLRAEGVDLIAATPCELGRGTPVYVEAGAPVVDVQRRMAENHIRSIPVLDDDQVVGVVDLVELALLPNLLGEASPTER
ncbi:MAG: CBS domain-containing protein [Actinomycetota bacterium]